MGNRSFLSKIAEFILWKTKPAYMTSKEEVKRFLDNKTEEKFKSIFNSENISGMEVVTFGKKYANSRVIIYVHGGAYVNELNIQHQIYCYLLSKILKIQIILPVYPLCPQHDNSESYK